LVSDTHLGRRLALIHVLKSAEDGGGILFVNGDRRMQSIGIRNKNAIVANEWLSFICGKEKLKHMAELLIATKTKLGL
jgi:hypothetical protein